MTRRMTQALLGSLLALAYVALVYACCVQQAPGWWTLLPLLAPLAWWSGARLSRPLRGRAAAFALPVLLVLAATAMLAWLEAHPQQAPLHALQVRGLYFLQETVILWLFCAVFVRSLLPGRTPLCTALATPVHREMTPRVIWYTRWVTVAWAGWLGLLWLASLVLFLWAEPATWAFFSSVLSPILMLALFGMEALARFWVLPAQDRPSLAATWQSARTVDWAAALRHSGMAGAPKNG